MTPSQFLNVDAYPDADFAGLYEYKDIQVPSCTRSQTSFVTTWADCPVFWQSKLHELSTMEVEVVAFVLCCHELIPILDLVNQIGDAVGL